MRFKKFIRYFIVLLALMLVISIVNNVARKNKMVITKLDEAYRLNVGRASVGVFSDYIYLHESASVDDVEISSKEAVSKAFFDQWVEKRWAEIKDDDNRRKRAVSPEIFKISPHSVWFKFSYVDIGKNGLSDPMFKGEGAIFQQNRALFLASGGSFGADKKIAGLLKDISFYAEGKKDESFCLGFYCINKPRSKKEFAEVSIQYPKYDGMVASFSTENYTSAQEEYSSTSSINDEYSYCYSNNKVKIVGGLEGRETICGMSEPTVNGIETSINATWFYAGMTGNENKPAITIRLLYEYKTTGAPAKNGWFDDDTMKKTGVSPEKFISIWESTLSSFRPSR